MYKPNGALIDVSLDEAVYDSFIFNEEKIVVLKNEQFDEFLDSANLGSQNGNFFLLGKLFSKDDTDYIFPLSREKYDLALKYYLSLRNAYLEVAKDGE